MEKKVVYSKGRTWAPHVESNFVVFLNLILLFMYKIIKAVSIAAKRIFPPGFDNKKIIKE